MAAQKNLQFPWPLAVFSALLAAVAMPTGQLGLLAFVAMVPMFYLYRLVSPAKALWLGLIQGALSWALCIHWMPSALMHKLSADVSLVAIPYILYCLYAGLPYALHGYLHSKLKLSDGILKTLVSAASLAALVTIQPLWMEGNLAHALYQWPVLMQVADIGGVSFLLALIFAVNAMIAYLIYTQPGSQRRTAQLVLVTLVMFQVGYGYLRTGDILDQYTNTDKHINVALVQPNMQGDKDVEDKAASRKAAFDELVRLTSIAVNADIKPDLIVWPELAKPFSAVDSTMGRNLIKSLNEITESTPLLVNSSYEYVKDIDYEGNTPYFNVSNLVTSSGIGETYRKQRLTPFGEHLPGSELWPEMRDNYPGFKRYVAGDETILFEVKGFKLLPLICYEATFSDLVAKGVDQGADILLNPSNDAWARGPEGSEYALALALMQTVEYHRPMVRVSNSGASMVIDASGQILEESRIENDAVGVRSVRLGMPETTSFFALYRNDILIVELILVGLALLVIWLHSHVTFRVRPTLIEKVSLQHL